MSNGFQVPWFFQEIRNTNQNPLSNGFFYTFQTKTQIPKTTYYDLAKTAPCPNPIPLDSAGFAPQYFLDAGLYTFAVYDKLIENGGVKIAGRDDIEGILGNSYNPFGSPSNSGYLYYNSSTSAYTWQSVSGTTNFPTPTSSSYLYYNSSTSAYQWANPTTNTYTVKVTSSDNTPGYLFGKVSATSDINLTSAGNILGISLNSLSGKYLPLSGGEVFGPVTFDLTPVRAITINAATGQWLLSNSNPNQLSFGTSAYNQMFQFYGSPGNEQITSNVPVTISNNLTVTGKTNLELSDGLLESIGGVVTSVPGNPFMVLTSGDDTIPGYLSNKLQPGFGINFNVTNDSVNGEVIHASVVTSAFLTSASTSAFLTSASTSALAQPSGQIVYGTGPSITSEAGLRFDTTGINAPGTFCLKVLDNSGNFVDRVMSAANNGSYIYGGPVPRIELVGNSIGGTSGLTNFGIDNHLSKFRIADFGTGNTILATDDLNGAITTSNTFSITTTNSATTAGITFTGYTSQVVLQNNYAQLSDGAGAQITVQGTVITLNAGYTSILNQLVIPYQKLSATSGVYQINFPGTFVNLNGTSGTLNSISNGVVTGQQMTIANNSSGNISITAPNIFRNYTLPSGASRTYVWDNILGAWV
jgi:hypothetical protein